VKEEGVKISVVIPVKNGEPWLDECIQGIMSQTLFNQTEIIAIDSGSTDGSLAILEKYPVRIYNLPPAEFNHGLTRNYGVRLCRGEYVVMTVQDAKPVNELWLQNLLHGFSAAENVAGVCGSQVVPHESDKNPVDWFRPMSEPVMDIYSYRTPEEFHALTPEQKMRVCSWDDVTAMYKKTVLQDIPFQKINCSEDAVWAKEALLSGYTIVYNPAAKVYHYHHADRDFVFRRTLTVMHSRYRHFGFLYGRPKQNLRQQLSIIKTIFLSEPLTLKEKWGWVLYNRRQLKSWQKAYDVFTEALAESEAHLDAVHDKFCEHPHIHQKRNKKPV
jgi:rhamnosyltransferase